MAMSLSDTPGRKGGRGDDRLEGGRDNDFLTGGLGADAFVFGVDNGVAVSGGTDRIMDFRVGVDDIELHTGVSITKMTTKDLNGDSLDDTVLTLSNGGTIEVLDVNNVSLAQWMLIA